MGFDCVCVRRTDETKMGIDDDTALLKTIHLSTLKYTYKTQTTFFCIGPYNVRN